MIRNSYFYKTSELLSFAFALFFFLFLVGCAHTLRPGLKTYGIFDGDPMYSVLPPGTIPAIMEPEFISGEEAAAQMYPEEQIVGVIHNGEAKAYSKWHLDAHQIVNDTIAGTAIAVTWCPFCYSDIVYARTIGNKTLNFMVSGKLWHNILIMQDKETGSLWSIDKALEGPMKGQRLEVLSSVNTTWASWVGKYPDTKVLRKEVAIRSSRYEDYYKNTNPIGIFRTRWLMKRMPEKSSVYGIVRTPHTLAITEEKIDRYKVLNVTVGDDSLVVFETADDYARAYLSQSGSQTLHFHLTEQPSIIKDKETGSTWDLNKGICLAGNLQGTTLDDVVIHRSLWFAWSHFYPNTEVID